MRYNIYANMNLTLGTRWYEKGGGSARQVMCDANQMKQSNWFGKAKAPRLSMRLSKILQTARSGCNCFVPQQINNSQVAFTRNLFLCVSVWKSNLISCFILKQSGWLLISYEALMSFWMIESSCCVIFVW